MRIRVQAVALGFVDGLIATGRYQMKPHLPFCPGGEIAGIVDLVGSDVRDIRVGERVATWQLGGGFAEYVTVSAAEAYPMPDGLSFPTAAAMLVDYPTARYALVERGQLRDGETVVVAGASGGLGSAAVQIAASLGVRVVALVSDLARQARATDLAPRFYPVLGSFRRLFEVQCRPHGARFVNDMRARAKTDREAMIGFEYLTVLGHRDQTLR